MLRFFTSTLRGKILFGFIIILTIMIFVTFWSIYNFYRLNESIKQTIYENYSSIVAVDNMDKALDDQLNAVIMMLNEDALAGSRKLETAKQDFYYWYDKSRQSAYTSEEKITLDSLDAFYRQFTNDSLFRTDPSVINSLNLQTRKEYFVSITSSLRQIRKASYKLFTINHNYINSVSDRVNNITATATIFMIVIILAGIIIGLIFSSRFSDYITKPLQNLTKSVRQIAGGNFEGRLEIIEEDEIGDLAAEFNKMSEKLAAFEKMNLQKMLYEKKKSEAVLENIYEPVAVKDKKKEILLVNQKFKQLFGDLDYEGEKLDTVIDKNDVFKELERIDRYGGSKAHDILFIYNDRNNKEYYFNIIPSAINLPEEDQEGIILVFNDITRLKELDKMKNEFIGKVSHELKTPLTSIGMAVGLIEESIKGNLTDKQKELIILMKEDYNRLNKLIIEILELSKLESDKLKTEFHSVDVKLFLEDIIKKYRLQVPSRDFNFEVRASNKGYFAESDQDLLKRAVENIIANSIKFTSEGGIIDIVLSHPDDYIRIKITDNGIGIMQEDIPRIFDKFVQVKNPVPGSVGLGLTIAKEIIDIHNGRIEVTSKLGEGTNFTILLPESPL